MSPNGQVAMAICNGQVFFVCVCVCVCTYVIDYIWSVIFLHIHIVTSIFMNVMVHALLDFTQKKPLHIGGFWEYVANVHGSWFLLKGGPLPCLEHIATVISTHPSPEGVLHLSSSSPIHITQIFLRHIINMARIYQYYIVDISIA